MCDPRFGAFRAPFPAQKLLNCLLGSGLEHTGHQPVGLHISVLQFIHRRSVKHVSSKNGGPSNQISTLHGNSGEQLRTHGPVLGPLYKATIELRFQGNAVNVRARRLMPKSRPAVPVQNLGALFKCARLQDE
jgi:hypothetical protein